jgi:hypothetical protein
VLILKVKEILDSIFVHGIVAYIILTSFSKTMELFNDLAQKTWLAIPLQIIILATTASILSTRIAPYNQYSFKHPVKLIGGLVFIVVVIVSYKLDTSGFINLIPKN